MNMTILNEFVNQHVTLIALAIIACVSLYILAPMLLHSRKVKDVAPRMSAETVFKGEEHPEVTKTILKELPDQFGRWKVTFKDGSKKTVFGSLKAWNQTNFKPIESYHKIA